MSRLEDWKIARLVELFPSMGNEEIARELGVSVSTVKSRGVKMGLRKSQEYLSGMLRLRALKGGFGERLQGEDVVSRRREAFMKKVKEERVRRRYGLEPRLKRHLRTEPRERLEQRNRLQRLGYVVDNEKLVAYWSEGTRRAVRLEKLKRGESKGGMRCWYDFAAMEQ